jgi:phage terminase large subunit-like protein
MEDRSHLVRLGTYQIDAKALRDLLLSLKGMKANPSLYAGDSRAPKGVSDLDDASHGELQDLKIICSNPKLTIQLGFRGAYTLALTRTKRTDGITTKIQAVLSPYEYPAASFRALRPILLLAAMWPMLTVLPILAQSIFISFKPLLILIVGMTPVAGISMLISIFSFHRKVRRLGCCSFSRRIKRSQIALRLGYSRVSLAVSIWLVALTVLQQILM